MAGGRIQAKWTARALVLASVAGAAALLLRQAPPVLTSTSAASSEALAQAEVAYYGSQLPAGLQAPGSSVDGSCFSSADNHVDPQPNSQGKPTNPQWYQRDTLNQYCATLRLRDQFTNPAFGYAGLTNGTDLWVQQAEQQLSDGPSHLHGGITTLIPGSQSADAFRALTTWEQQTGGSATPVSFSSSDGAVLRGYVFLPPRSVPTPSTGYPGVVITDGSIQGFENLYYWAAEGLAQYGYEVMTYDVQGQGDSDLLPGSCAPSQAELQAGSLCTGVPYQQSYNFYQGAEDSLGFFDSAANPAYGLLDTNEIGIAGHSLGAEAVSWVGQCDVRVKAIVAWDDLAPVDVANCPQNVTVPSAYRSQPTSAHGGLHAPALAMSNDYEFNPEPQTTVPNPHGTQNGGGLDGDAGYLSLSKAGVDSLQVSLRNGTHLTYSYVPYVLPANELGERFAFYYTLAWFDEYLRSGSDSLLPAADSAFGRLADVTAYDHSADYNNIGPVSIGTGTFDAQTVLADPTNREAGNVPYEIAGISIPDTLSFYYYSEFSLTDPVTGIRDTCTDILAGCPSTQPPTP